MTISKVQRFTFTPQNVAFDGLSSLIRSICEGAQNAPSPKKVTGKLLLLFFCFNGHFFLGGIQYPRLAGTRMSPFEILLELRMMEVVVKIGAERRAKLQTNRHHQQINTQFFTGRISCFQPSVRALQETSHCFVLKTDCFKVSCLDHRVCGPHAFAASVVAVTTPPLLHCTQCK